MAALVFVLVGLPYTYGQGSSHAAAEGHALGRAFDKRYAGAVSGGQANRGGAGDRLIRARRGPWLSSTAWVALWLGPEANGAPKDNGADRLLEPGASSVAVSVAPHRVSIPVLMYHEIGDGPNELYVSRESFTAQIALLAREGYSTISLDQLHAALTTGGPLPARPIVLTFDDGYESAYEVAFPTLAEHKFSGVFFIPTRTVGVRNRATWEQLQEMQAAGMDIESHTVNHLDLEAISSDWTKLIQETLGSREELHAQLGASAEYLCYPAGRYNAKVLEALKLSGFKGAFTTKPGWATSVQDPLEWHRVRISRSDDLSTFASKIGIEP